MKQTCTETAPQPCRERAGRWRLWILVAVACLAWLPGLSALPALDRDESRFAQASLQMAETGNFVDIRLGSSPRYNKPIGIYWLQAGFAKTLELFTGSVPRRIWLYRLPSFVCGVLSLFLTFSCLRLFASSNAALVAALLLGSTLLVSAESEIATTDAALLASILAAQTSLMRVRSMHANGERAPLAATLAGWAAVGVGVLIKGPVIVAVVSATALTLCFWDRDWRWLKATRPLSGIAIAAAIAAPWAIAIGVASHGAFYEKSLGHDFAAKLAGGQESHGAPPGYYLALLSVTFWPATLFLIPALDIAVRRRNDPSVRFLLSWAVSSFIMFELVPTKLPHYILPAYPALAMLSAIWITERDAMPPSRGQGAVRIVACVQFALGALAIAAVPFVLPQRFGAASPPWTTTAAVLAIVAAGGAILLVLRGQKIAALAASGACALILYPTLAAGVAPQLRPLWISERVATLVKRDSRPHDPPLVSAGYAEPSLLFRLGGATRLATGFGAANITSAQGGLALLEDRERAAFLARIAELQAFAMPLDQFSGFDYSNGKAEHFTIYRVSQVPQELER